MSETIPKRSADASQLILKILRVLLGLVGSIALLLGATADLLRSSRDPGLGSAQIGLMLIGLALLLSSYALRSPAYQAKLRPLLRDPWKIAAVALISTLVVAVALEAVLAFRGARPLNGRDSKVELTLARWWTCDRLGCRFDPAHLPDVPTEVSEPNRQTAARIFFDRLQVVNSHGFHDDDEFVPSPALQQKFRILVLGDSHAFGFYAGPGKSWVELLEESLKPAGDLTVWNTGIPGAATVQELEVLKRYFPIMKPDLVILGFYPGNDLDGNLHPADNFYASTRGMLFPKHKIGPGFEPIAMAPAEAFRQATGLVPAADAGTLEAGLGKTRAGTLLLQRWARLRPSVEWLWSSTARWAPGSEARREEAISRTTRLLGEIETLTKRGSRFLLLLIPGPNDLAETGSRYQMGRAILDDLDVEVFAPLEHLASEDYVPSDEHWNDAGHEKVARLLAEHIRSSWPPPP